MSTEQKWYDLENDEYLKHLVDEVLSSSSEEDDKPPLVAERDDLHTPVKVIDILKYIYLKH